MGTEKKPATPKNMKKGKAVENAKNKIKSVGEKINPRNKITERTLGRVKTKTPRSNRSKLLISIVNQHDAEQLKEILDECSVSLSIAFGGTGTARSSVLNYLGIGESEKAVVISLFPESDEDRILRVIQTRMSLYLVGRGISFTVPLSGVSGIIAGGLAKAATEKTVDGRKIMTNEERKYDLIIAVVEANRSEEAMEAARSAGAAGGTVIRARSLDNAKAEQFIGISLSKEQEILLILSKREAKLAIMETLSEKVGLKTEAGGVIFSLPVDRTAGIGAAGETDERAGNQEKPATPATEAGEAKEEQSAESPQPQTEETAESASDGEAHE